MVSRITIKDCWDSRAIYTFSRQQAALILGILVNSWGTEMADGFLHYFDGRNLYEPNTVTPFGLRYFAIGRSEQLG